MSSSSSKQEKPPDKPLIKFGPFEQALAVLVVMGFGEFSCTMLMARKD